MILLTNFFTSVAPKWLLKVENSLCPYGSTFVYNICLISISDTVSDGATKKHQFWTLKGHNTMNCPEEFEPDVLNTFCTTRIWKLKILHDWCMSSLALLPSRSFAVFQNPFLFEYYTQRAKTFTNYSEPRLTASSLIRPPSLLQPLYCGPNKSSVSHFLNLKNPSDTSTPLIRRDVCGPLMTSLTGLHCTKFEKLFKWV